jgi:hypothetical protein
MTDLSRDEMRKVLAHAIVTSNPSRMTPPGAQRLEWAQEVAAKRAQELLPFIDPSLAAVVAVAVLKAAYDHIRLASCFEVSAS